MNILTKLAVLVTANLPSVPDRPTGMEQHVIDRYITIFAWTKWIGLLVVVAGLIGFSVPAIQSRRGEGGEHVRKIGKVLKGVVIIGAVVALAGYLLGSFIRLRISM